VGIVAGGKYFSLTEDHSGGVRPDLAASKY
jgi:hypothetical protein